MPPRASLAIGGVIHTDVEEPANEGAVISSPRAASGMVL